MQPGHSPNPYPHASQPSQPGPGHQYPGAPPPNYAPPAEPPIPQGPRPGPPPELSMMDALFCLFRDENWPSHLMWGTLAIASQSVVPLIGRLALYGWTNEFAQRLNRRQRPAFPKFRLGDAGHYAERGGAQFAAGMAVWLPLILLTVVVIAVFSAMVDVASPVGHRGGAIGALFTLFSFFVCVIALGFGFILSGVLSTIAELTESVGETFKPQRITQYFMLTATEWLWAAFVWVLTAPLIFSVGILFCGVGSWPAYAWISVFGTHTRYQIYRIYLHKGGEPFPVRSMAQIPSERGVEKAF